MRTLDGLLAAIGDPARPLLTFYDQATGERVELSGVTTANWVAKTSNLLVDELDAVPGTRIRLGLPTHWQRFVWMLAAWNVGASVVDTRADIGLSGPDLVADEPIRLAASLRPLGGPFAQEPVGFTDIAREVPGQGDHFLALDPPLPTTEALDLHGEVLTHADLCAAEPDDRRLLIEPGDIGRDAALIVAACRGGGSLVVVTSATPDARVRIATQEEAVTT